MPGSQPPVAIPVRPCVMKDTAAIESRSCPPHRPAPARASQRARRAPVSQLSTAAVTFLRPERSRLRRSRPGGPGPGHGMHGREPHQPPLGALPRRSGARGPGPETLRPHARLQALAAPRRLKGRGRRRPRRAIPRSLPPVSAPAPACHAVPRGGAGGLQGVLPGAAQHEPAPPRVAGVSRRCAAHCPSAARSLRRFYTGFTRMRASRDAGQPDQASFRVAGSHEAHQRRRRVSRRAWSRRRAHVARPSGC